MGAITDGSYKKFGYGTGEGQVDIATQMRLANQGRVTQGEMIARGAASIFLSLTSKIAEGSMKADDKVAEDATPEEIEAKRQEVLKELKNTNPEYNCDNVGDIEALIVEKNSQLNQANEQVASLNTEINNVNTKISTLDSNINALKDEILDARAQGENYNGDINALEANLKDLEKQKEALENKINNELKPELEKTQALQSTLPNEISNLETSKKALANLDKQLEKANKKDAVKKWDDESTQDIVGLIKKYNEYNAAGKTEKAEELKNGKLKEAIEAYSQSHKVGDNKTIDSLIAMVNKK